MKTATPHCTVSRQINFNCARPGCHNPIDTAPKRGNRSRYCTDPECAKIRNRERRRHAPRYITCPICGATVPQTNANQVTCSDQECKAKRKCERESRRAAKLAVDHVLVDGRARLAGVDRGGVWDYVRVHDD